MALTLPKINIGAGKRHFPGWINADIIPGPKVDVVFDACKPWPFEDNSIGMVFGNQMLEHLTDPMAFFKEAHRVLVPGGRLEVTMPYGFSNEAIADPTHLKSWIPASFCFLQPGWGEECGNPQHDEWTACFGVEMCLRYINDKLRWWMRPFIRNITVRVLPFLWNAYINLTVGLLALKDDASKKAWRVDHWPQMVKVCDVMYEHSYRGRELGPSETKRVIFFAERGDF